MLLRIDEKCVLYGWVTTTCSILRVWLGSLLWSARLVAESMCFLAGLIATLERHSRVLPLCLCSRRQLANPSRLGCVAVWSALSAAIASHLLDNLTGVLRPVVQ